MNKLSIVLGLILLLVAFAPKAHAVHGSQVTGYGPIQEAMSGVGVAAPLDAHVIAINPAGIVRVPNRVDFSVQLGMPVMNMNTSAAPAGNAAAGNQGNEKEVFPMPFISTVWGFMDDKLALGLSFVQNGGAAASYKQSRGNPAITGNTFDTFINYHLYKVIPAISYSILDNLSIGASFQMGYATFGSDMMITSTLAQTNGRGRSENSFGFGGSVGLLYEPMDELALGVSYTSVLHFTKLGKYSDLLNNNKLNTPRQVRAEIAGWPLEDWLLTAGFHWINWRSVSVLGDRPVDGGLGWNDQYIAKFGTQYTIKDRVNLRLGYNWQSSLLSNNVIYANALSPLIAEHTINAGVGVNVTDHWSFDLAFGMSLKKSMTESGTGGPISQAGAGTQVNYAGYAGVLGFSYNWD
jgi:long-subunit fatty acid transport protein